MIANTDGKIQWGLSLFPPDNACGMARIDVPVEGGATAITATLGSATPDGNTPSRVAIARGAAYLKSLGRPNPRYILLATDGNPTSDMNGNMYPLWQQANTYQPASQSWTFSQAALNSWWPAFPRSCRISAPAKCALCV